MLGSFAVKVKGTETLPSVIGRNYERHASSRHDARAAVRGPGRRHKDVRHAILSLAVATAAESFSIRLDFFRRCLRSVITQMRHAASAIKMHVRHARQSTQASLQAGILTRVINVANADFRHHRSNGGGNAQKSVRPAAPAIQARVCWPFCFLEPATVSYSVH